MKYFLIQVILTALAGQIEGIYIMNIIIIFIFPKETIIYILVMFQFHIRID